MAYHGSRLNRTELPTAHAFRGSSPVRVYLVTRYLTLIPSHRCNSAPEFPAFFGMTHANMVHVSDLRVLLTPDSNHSDFKTVGFYSPVAQEPFYAGLGLFELALDEWLPCFAQKEGGDQTAVHV